MRLNPMSMAFVGLPPFQLTSSFHAHAGTVFVACIDAQETQCYANYGLPTIMPVCQHAISVTRDRLVAGVLYVATGGISDQLWRNKPSRGYF